MTLRPYQLDAVAAIEAAWAERQGTLCVLGTGLGKTRVLAEVLRRRFLANAGRAMVVNDNEAIIRQLARSIRRYADLDVGVEKAERSVHEGPHGQRRSVVVASVQTLTHKAAGPRRLEKFAPILFGTLAFDEAHRSMAASWRSVHEYFAGVPALKVLGLTATPGRHDGRSLSPLYGPKACFAYGAPEGVRDGWLVPIEQAVVHVTGLDYSGIAERGSDLDPEELDAILREEGPLHRMTSSTYEIAGSRRCLVFCASVDHAKLFASILNRYRRGCAAAVWGSMNATEKEITIEDWGYGRFQFLCNCNLLTEGWDDPANDGLGVQVISVARPTKVLGRYMQIAGRGLRPLEGIVDRWPTPELRRAAIAASPKPSVEIIDFLGVTGKHRLCMATDLLAGVWDKETTERAAREAVRRSGDGKPVNVEATLREAADEIEKEREEARRASVKPRALYRVQRVNPFSPSSDDLVAPKRLPKDSGPPATDGQLAYIRARDPKFRAWPGITKKQAGAICAKLPWFTPKQGYVLRRQGHKPEELTKEEGRALLDEILGGARR